MVNAMAPVNACLSEVAEGWIKLDGKNFRLDDWPMHRAIYDGRYLRTLLKTSRQVGKSTTLANFCIIECSLIPHFSTMFVTPSKEQTVRFSNSRVQKTMRYSPIINRRFLHPELSDRVFHKQFTNGAEMLFTYALDDADRLRGPSVDRVNYDEIQDLLHDPVVIVGNETLSESDYQFETYAGTPKTMENTIEYLWEKSTQTEWVIRCDACGQHQYIDSDKCIGKKGPECLHCRALLDPRKGQWIDMNPPKIDQIHPETILKGFHINQLIMPSNVPRSMQNSGQDMIERAEKRWARILRKYEESPNPAVFKNEVLGISDAIGARLISLEELESLCLGPTLVQFPTAANFQGYSMHVAGIDWSGGGQAGLSRTVLWIWGFRPQDQKLVCRYYKVFPNTNPVHVVEEITTICAGYEVAMVIGDAGEGMLPNSTLSANLGPHRVHQVQYGAQKEAIKWNGRDRYTADRTTLIDNFFMMLKRAQVEFGPLPEMKAAIEDILNEYEEVTQTGRKVWRHSPQRPDDCLHAAIFGWVALKLVQNDMKFYH